MQATADKAPSVRAKLVSTHPPLSTTPKQLQKKFKHAHQFGITGNWTPANAQLFAQALVAHVNGATLHIEGRYKNAAVIHHLNTTTGLNVIQLPSGAFLSGWKLSAAQMERVLEEGVL